MALLLRMRAFFPCALPLVALLRLSLRRALAEQRRVWLPMALLLALCQRVSRPALPFCSPHGQDV